MPEKLGYDSPMNGDYRRFGALSSSEDPQKLAATVTGIVKAIGGAVAFLGVSTITGDVNTLADQLGQMVTLGYAFWGVAEAAFGIGRKILIAVQQKLSSGV